jgi:hypothetical protein
MDSPSQRALVSQLGDDLGWLEEHCRRQPDLAAQAGVLRLAAALVRNGVGPYLDGQPPTPLHLAVVGGAGAGKSTVVNFLIGTNAAEANPQAGFTRHPIAYTHADGTLAWPNQLGFLGPLQRLTTPTPSNLDQDVYQIRKVPTGDSGSQLLHDFIVWDCPDMTTWAAAGYVPRLLEVAGLADVIVYVASDERYNDAVPTQFLRLLLEAGKPVIVCLTKMSEAAAATILAHFQKEVLERVPPGRVKCLAIPHLTPEELSDPRQGKAKEYRTLLLNQVAVLGDAPAATRRRTVESITRFLTGATERLLAVARDDVAVMQKWRAEVHYGQLEFDQRYRREYLTSEKFRRFDEALVRLIDLLELPGVGKAVSTALYVVRTPYRLLKGALGKMFAPPTVPTIPEGPILEAALTAWLDQLRASALRRSNRHPLWEHVAEGFEHDLSDQARAKFQQLIRNFQLSLADEVERTARAIYEELEKSPAQLNTLRGGKLALDVAAISSSLVIGHIGLQDFILVPLAAAVSHQLVEWLGASYVEAQRDQTRQRQQALMTQQVSGPLAEWLAQWPATGGTSYERLQLALSRIPPALQQLDAAVRQKAVKAGDPAPPPAAA